MRFWIDIEDAAGNRLGDGPITTAVSWTSRPRLDRAGEFSLTLPIGDPRAALLIHRRIVRCYTFVSAAGGVVEIGAGIIEHRSVAISGGATMLTVRGPDLMIELASRLVHDLQIYEEVVQSPDYANYLEEVSLDNFVGHDMSAAFDGNMATWATIDPATYLYIGHRVPWPWADVYLRTANPEHGILYQAQYFNGWGWVDCIGFSDGTALANGPLGEVCGLEQSGRISHTPQPDWIWMAHANQNLYWLRIRYAGTNIRGAEIYEIEILGRGPAADDLAPIMALAPTGWSLDTANWHDATAAGSYLQFAGETVLAALIRVAENSGEHFRLGPGRTIQWLRSDRPASGIRAARATEHALAQAIAPELCLITSLIEESDSSELVTRLYPYGAGNGAARVTLADATDSPPAGYIVNTAANFIQHSAGFVAYGLIEAPAVFEQIQPLDNDGTGRAAAGNELLRAAVAYLERAAAPAKFYRLQVAKLDTAVLPGQTIHVVWREMVDGVVIADINEELLVLESAVAIDSAGIRTHDLMVSTVDRWPVSDADLIAKQVERLGACQAHPQPEARPTVGSLGVTAKRLGDLVIDLKQRGHI